MISGTSNLPCTKQDRSKFCRKFSGFVLISPQVKRAIRTKMWIIFQTNLRSMDLYSLNQEKFRCSCCLLSDLNLSNWYSRYSQQQHLSQRCAFCLTKRCAYSQRDRSQFADLFLPGNQLLWPNESFVSKPKQGIIYSATHAETTTASSTKFQTRFLMRNSLPGEWQQDLSASKYEVLNSLALGNTQPLEIWSKSSKWGRLPAKVWRIASASAPAWGGLSWNSKGRWVPELVSNKSKEMHASHCFRYVSPAGNVWIVLSLFCM
jgi:hypothetical protein